MNSRARRAQSHRLPDLDIDRTQLARELAPLVLAEITRLAKHANEPKTYNTRAGGQPPGWSIRTWQKIAPTIPGAAKRGRWYVVTAEALAAWERQEPNDRADNGNSGHARWSPDAALRNAQLRASR